MARTQRLIIDEETRIFVYEPDPELPVEEDFIPSKATINGILTDITVWGIGLITLGPPTQAQKDWIADPANYDDLSTFPGDWISTGFPSQPRPIAIGTFGTDGVLFLPEGFVGAHSYSIGGVTGSGDFFYSALSVVSGTQVGETIQGTDFAETLVGLGGDDILIGGDGGDALFGGDGNDHLIGGSGRDRLSGGAGDDILEPGPAPFSAFSSIQREGGSNDYTDPGILRPDHIFIDGGEGHDTLVLDFSESRNSQSLVGDRILASPQVANVEAVWITGSQFNDTIMGSASDDRLIGGDGFDVLKGGAGNDFLDAGEPGTGRVGDLPDGGRTREGALSLDHLFSQGADGPTVEISLVQEPGSHVSNEIATPVGNIYSFSVDQAGRLGWFSFTDIFGTNVFLDYTITDETGAIIDTFPTSDFDGPFVFPHAGTYYLRIDFASRNFDGRAFISAELTVEGADILANDILDGGAGDDTLLGRSGDDTLLGGTGDDALIGGAGQDILDGGEGYDLADFSDAGAAVTVDLEAGTAISPEGDDHLRSIEHVRGSSFDDTLIAGLSYTGSSPVLKLASDSNTAPVTAVDLDGRFALWLNDDVTDAGKVPHVTVKAQGSGGFEYYSITVSEPNSLITIDIDGADFDTEVRILTPAGVVVAENDDNFNGDPGSTSGLDSFLQFRIAVPGQYLIQVVRFDEQPVPSGTGYTMHVSLENVPTAQNRLEGGSGDDVLTSRSGNIVLDGGLGNDVFFVNSASDVVVERAGEGNDRVVSSVSYRLAADAEVETLETSNVSGVAAIDLAGSNSANRIFGNAGPNKLQGEGGDDTLHGLAGNDELYGQAGNDTLLGGAGSDLLDGGAGDDVLLGGLDSDVLFGGEGNDELHGQEGDDYMEGGAGADRMDGGAGNDTLVGGTGNDVLFGGDGDDVLHGQDGDDYIDTGSGVNRAFGGAGRDTLIGGIGADSLYGGADADLVLGGAGNDVLFGDAGADEMHGQDGDDYIDGGSENDRLFGGAGSDTVIGGAGNDTVFGDSGNDDLHGQEGDDYIDGGAGADRLVGGLGNDLMVGGADNDVLFGNDGADELHGQDGDDYIEGNRGADRLFGGLGNDTLVGGSENDVLFGNAGNDVLHGEEGDDYMEGGEGLNRLFGGAGADTLIGGSQADQLYGGSEADRLFGGAGNDTLFGDGGADTLHGQEGDDYIDGGDDADNLYGGAGNDTLIGGAGNDGLFGDAGNDVLHGQDGDDYMDGGAGADTLFAGAGNDTVLGGADNDTLFGNEGNDEIHGQDGDDRIEGGAGADRLFGGAGNDKFVFSALADSTSAARDQIFDLTAGDKIDLSAIDAIAGTAANDAFTFIGTAVFSQKAGELRTYQEDGKWIVDGDVDGDGIADFSLVLTNGHTPAAADFIL